MINARLATRDPFGKLRGHTQNLAIFSHLALMTARFSSGKIRPKEAGGQRLRSTHSIPHQVVALFLA